MAPEATFFKLSQLNVLAIPNVNLEFGSGASVTLAAKIKSEIEAWAALNSLAMSINLVQEKNAITPGGALPNKTIVGYQGDLRYTDRTLATMHDGLLADLAPSLEQHLLDNVAEMGVVHAGPKIVEGSTVDVRSGTVGLDLIANSDMRESKGKLFETPVFEMDVQDASAKLEITNLAPGKSAEVSLAVSSGEVRRQYDSQKLQANTVAIPHSIEMLDAYASIPAGMIFSWGIKDLHEFSMEFFGDSDPDFALHYLPPGGGELIRYGIAGPNNEIFEPLSTIPAGATLHTWLGIDIRAVGSGFVRALSNRDDPSSFEVGQAILEAPTGTLTVLGGSGSGQRRFWNPAPPFTIGSFEIAQKNGSRTPNMVTRFMRWSNSAATVATGTFKVRVHDARTLVGVSSNFLSSSISIEF